MAITLAAVAVGMAAVSIISSITGNSAQAAAQRRQIRANRLAAKSAYSATEDSVNIMKAVTREQTLNATAEVLRAGAAQNTEVVQKVEEVTSKAIASNEGLTSGASRGRALITMQVQGQKALSASKSQTASQMNQLVDQQDKQVNDLNNKLMAAYQDMSSTLANEGAAITGNTQRVLSSGISGAAAGASLGSSFGL